MSQHDVAIDGAPKVSLAAIICGAAISFALLVIFFDGSKANFEDAAAFGAQTTSIFARVGGHPVHCMDSRDVVACIDGARSRGAERTVLWLGNSQVHAVNQLRHGDTNAVPLLFDSLKRRDLDLLTFSQPNANLQEHYVLFEYLRRELPLRVLVLPVVFDDFREEGLRAEIAVLARDESTASSLLQTDVGRRLAMASRAMPQDQETAGIAKTMQERVERALNGWLEKNSQLWAARPAIRGELFIAVYKFRNSLFGIKATSKRKMIPGRYRENWAALQAIMDSAERNGISVVSYAVPLRGDVEIPYDASEYSRFKSDLESLARKRGAIYANLEALVPPELWGSKEATGFGETVELDFMHFQVGGHRILAARLEQLILDALSIAEKQR